MDLIIRGYKPITIPRPLLKPMEGFASQTSYIGKIASRWNSPSYLTAKLPSKLLCLEVVRGWAQELGDYNSYADVLAGVGLSERIFTRGGEKKGSVYLNDMDAGCCEVLRLNCPEANVTAYDILHPHRKLPSADLLFLDFNDYTLKRGTVQYRDVLERATSAARKYVVLNDCTPFYLRYGGKAFEVYSEFMGRSLKTVEDYFCALGAHYRAEMPWMSGWSLVGVAYFGDSSFQLFARVRRPLVLRKITNVPLGMVTVGGGLF